MEKVTLVNTKPETWEVEIACLLAIAPELLHNFWLSLFDFMSHAANATPALSGTDTRHAEGQNNCEREPRQMDETEEWIKWQKLYWF